MAKINKSMLKNVKKAFQEVQKEQQQNQQASNQVSIPKTLTYEQKRQIREESFDNHKVKVTWNINPGDLVKIKARVSPTGKEIVGLVTWGVNETVQRAPYLGGQKNLKNYSNSVRVMSSAGYHFFPANAMIVIS